MKYRKNKGFTLIEVLVAITCSTIFLATIISSLYFISRMSKEVISSSSNMYKISIVKDYVVENKDIINIDDFCVVDGTVYDGEKTIVFNSNIKNISFRMLETFCYCDIYYGDEIYSFIYKVN